MQFLAEHIIGLRATDYAQPDNPSSAANVLAHYRQICAECVLRTRNGERKIGEDGSSFALDHLAGDTKYIFFSYGPRYRHLRPAHLCYGFAFDAKQLILEHGALVGPDLAADYDDLLDEAVRQVDASLPSLPVDEESIAEFIEAMGETDPAMIEHLRQSSTSRHHDLVAAVQEGDDSVEGASEAKRLFMESVRRLQARKRWSGQEALFRLEPGFEILVSNAIPLSLAVARIEAGEIIDDPTD